MNRPPSPQMGMMGNVGPYGGPYGQSAGQGLGGAGLAPQLQNKAGLPNSLAHFNLDKKPQPMQGMAGMVSNQPTCRYVPFLTHAHIHKRTHTHGLTHIRVLSVSPLLQHECFLILVLHSTGVHSTGPGAVVVLWFPSTLAAGNSQTEVTLQVLCRFFSSMFCIGAGGDCLLVFTCNYIHKFCA